MADEPENATVFSETGRVLGRMRPSQEACLFCDPKPPAEGGKVFRESQSPFVRIPAEGAFVWK